jgi:hypothetical protein
MNTEAANARLRKLGYEPEEASVAPDDAGARLVVQGTLVNETVTEPDDMAAILRMLPPKSDLVAYRVLLGRPFAPGEIALTRCAWCGSFSKDGRHWFHTDLRPVPAGSASGGICPSCFGKQAPAATYP